MFGWLRAWVKAWMHTRELQQEAAFKRYFKEYVDTEMERQAKEMKDAKICSFAVTVMYMMLAVGAIMYLAGIACLAPMLVLGGMLMMVCANASLGFLRETGRIRKEARIYAFERMRGE